MSQRSILAQGLLDPAHESTRMAQLADDFQQFRSISHSRQHASHERFTNGAFAISDYCVRISVANDPSRMTRTRTDSPFSDEWLGKNIPSRFARIAEEHSACKAIVTQAGSVTYAELSTSAKSLALHLSPRRGSEAAPTDDTAVLISAPDPKLAVTAILAAQFAGRTPVVSVSPRQLLAMATAFPHADIVASDDVFSVLMDRHRVVDPANLPGLPQDFPPLPAIENISCDVIAQAILTSGSTGMPKAVLHSHAAILNQARNFTEAADITADDRIALIAPLNSITGQSSLFGALLNGATACYFNIEQEGIDNFSNWLISEKITLLHATPTVYRRLADTLNSKGFPDRLEGVRLARIGGEPFMSSDLKIIASITRTDCRIYLGYGCSEMGTVSKKVIERRDIDSVQFGDGVPVGATCENITLEIHGEGDRPLPDGNLGEIVISSRYLSAGYWNDDDGNHKAYSEVSGDGQRRYRTGDIGMIRHGELFLRGRFDRQVKVRGHRIELDAVEAELAAIPGIGEVAVESSQYVNNGNPSQTILTAFVAARDEALKVPMEIRIAASDRLSPAMVPSRFVVLDSLPHTITGKIDRQALPALAENYFATENREQTQPRSETEDWLLELWRTMLHKRNLSTGDDFFEVGGDSMTAVRMFHEIARRTGLVLPVSTLLETPTVEELAERIRVSQGNESLILTLRALGSRPPLFLIHDIGGNVLNYRRFAQLLGEDQPIFGIRSPALESDSKSACLPESVEALAALYIEAVTEVAGERPFALGGLSFGGKVAFEMARQLNLAGREVAYVSLFDTRFEMAELPESSNSAWKTSFRRAWYQVRRAGFHARNVFAKPSSEGENYLEGRLRKRRKKARARQGSTGPAKMRDPRDELSPEQLAAAWHRKIGTAYHPHPIPVPIQYFCAQDVPLAGPFNNMANWNYLATGVFNVIPVPGNHTSILEEPNVTILAQEFCRNAYSPAPRPPSEFTHEPGLESANAT
jgi:acyl-coenzyme A synthetase/AMP-(fatty) acid ligase/thioesterase domain-containing protein